LSLASLLATQEVEIRRSQLQTNSLHISKKNPTQNRAGGVAQVNSSRISKREAEFKPQWPAPAPQKKKILVTRSVSALQEFQFGIHAETSPVGVPNPASRMLHWVQIPDPQTGDAYPYLHIGEYE
jgi:hypothetical protein